MGLKNYKIQNTKYKQIPNYKLQITNINKPALQLPNSPSPQFPNSPIPQHPTHLTSLTHLKPQRGPHVRIIQRNVFFVG